MKSKAKVIREYPEFKKLINAVIDRVGLESVEDINRHGIDGGFNGFIYYADTHAFAMKHRTEIVKLLETEAEDFRTEIPEMVRNFGVFQRGDSMDANDRRELYKYIGGGSPEQSTIINLMAWYAAETVCRWFED